MREIATDDAEATPEQARQLTDRIKITVEGAWELIRQAHVSRAWAALGYLSWDEYCDREFGTSRLKLPREERREVVASMREHGMSVRAIASATGQGYGTVQRDVSASGDPSGSPDSPESTAPSPREHRGERQPAEITGLDGKTYTSPTMPTSMRRSPLPQQFLALHRDLIRVSNRLSKLHGDDRFTANAATIAEANLPELERAAAVLNPLIDDLRSSRANNGPGDD
ncbi:hypothetical protein H7X46_22500 [Pseudonocardia sp. C8]|uniref:hypothetical protein n=1 Tax=Pseudonocardia sp. C8 TaxID=2762759 RepID=UPI00164362CC|nr:hypothetical protein [Pseudonocardia sp. C8]MBC3193836.1 hypothetical protein [Pseudonocardia sp. C8]